jgi:uncharacterized protein YecE (DUF72 family)
MIRPNQLKVGCLSWTYPDWAGSFYPKGTKSSDYLEFYSSVFDIVEVDSTFYRTPTVETIRQWKQKTPLDFTFTVKLPQRISHAARGKDTSHELAYFQSVVKNLGGKLGCVVAQMPPHFKLEKDLERLKELISQMDPAIRLAVELRHKSWYDEAVYDFLNERKVSLVWAVNEFVENDVEPIATADFLYLRFRGEFKEFNKFDRVQKEKTVVLKKWWDSLSQLLDKKEAERAFVLISNHFEGFAPETARRFRMLAGMDTVDWKAQSKANVPGADSTLV